MNINKIENLDFYKCSLKDINKAYNLLGSYLKSIIKKGEFNSIEFKHLKNLHISISRARNNMTPEGFMIPYNNDVNRLPNEKSIL